MRNPPPSRRPGLRAVSAAAAWITIVTAPGAELLHYWDFEGEDPWNDKAGTAHGLVTEFTTLELVPGVDDEGTAMGVSIEISGEDDFLALDAAGLFQPGPEGFTVTYWFRMPDDGTNDPRGIFDFSGNAGDGMQSLFIGASSELAFRVDVEGSDFALVKLPEDLEDDAWHFVAATYLPGGDLEVHLDGFGPDGAAVAPPVEAILDPFPYLGAFNFTGALQPKGLGGRLDDFAIFSGILTENEITALFERTLAPDQLGPLPFRITSVILDEVAGEITIRWPSKAGASYSVWESSDLADWAEIADSIIGRGGEQVFTSPVPESAERYYLRVRED